MKSFRPLLLAGIMTAGVTALAAYAYAGDGGLKTLILQLPGGSVQQIDDAGKPAPEVVMLPPEMAMPMPAAFLDADMPAAGAPVVGDPFARLDQISAIMNAQTAAMMSAMNVMMTQGIPGAMLGQSGLVPAAFAAVPPGGSASYAFISATSGGARGACMESVQITAMGPGQSPKVVSRRAGDCAGGSFFGQRPAAVLAPHVQQQAPLVPAVMAPAASPGPRIIRARVETPVSLPQPSQT